MAQRLVAAVSGEDPRVAAAIEEALGPSRRPTAACSHMPPPGFRPGAGVAIAVTVTSRTPASVRLVYRHVNQAERYEALEMEARGGVYGASIPAAYTDSPWPLQYYFELKDGAGQAWLYPGFAPDLLNQPYFVLRRA
jgi:hypothetical protein